MSRVLTDGHPSGLHFLHCFVFSSFFSGSRCELLGKTGLDREGQWEFRFWWRFLAVSLPSTAWAPTSGRQGQPGPGGVGGGRFQLSRGGGRVAACLWGPCDDAMGPVQAGFSGTRGRAAEAASWWVITTNGCRAESEARPGKWLGEGPRKREIPHWCLDAARTPVE